MCGLKFAFIILLYCPWLMSPVECRQHYVCRWRVLRETQLGDKKISCTQQSKLSSTSLICLFSKSWFCANEAWILSSTAMTWACWRYLQMFVQPRLIGKTCLWRHAKYCFAHVSLHFESEMFSGAKTILNVELKFRNFHKNTRVLFGSKHMNDLHLHVCSILGAWKNKLLKTGFKVWVFWKW